MSQTGELQVHKLLVESSEELLKATTSIPLGARPRNRRKHGAPAFAFGLAAVAVLLALPIGLQVLTQGESDPAGDSASSPASAPLSPPEDVGESELTVPGWEQVLLDSDPDSGAAAEVTLIGAAGMDEPSEGGNGVGILSVWDGDPAVGFGQPATATFVEAGLDVAQFDLAVDATAFMWTNAGIGYTLFVENVSSEAARKLLNSLVESNLSSFDTVSNLGPATTTTSMDQ